MDHGPWTMDHTLVVVGLAQKRGYITSITSITSHHIHLLGLGLHRCVRNTEDTFTDLAGPSGRPHSCLMPDEITTLDDPAFESTNNSIASCHITTARPWIRHTSTPTYISKVGTEAAKGCSPSQNPQSKTQATEHPYSPELCV